MIPTGPRLVAGSLPKPGGAPGAGARARRARRWVRTHPGMVVLCAVPIVVFGLPQLFGSSFLDGDNFLQNFPLRVLVGRDLRHGVLPLWNPYLFGGTPLLGGFNAGAAYPATWLTAVLPVFAAWWLTLAAAYDVAVVGMYLFLRRQSVSSTAATFGAATFGCAGYMSAQIVHVDLITGAAWLPWMLMAVQALTGPGDSGGTPTGRGSPGTGARRRAWVAVLAVSLGLTILSGGAEAIIESAVLVFVYWVGRVVATGLFGRENRHALVSSVAGIATGLVGGVALGAAQWLPGVAFLSRSQRAVPTYTFFTSGSLPARLVILLASPFVLGTNQDHLGTYAGPYNLPEVTSYVGILALIAACTLLLRRYRTRPEARQWWVWYAIAALGLLAALGGQTPFGHVMYLIPGISSERLLSRNLLLVDFSLAVLLAWWVHLLLAASEGRPADPSASVRRRWDRGERAELVVTCAPLAVVTALCVFLWADGPELLHLLEVQFPLDTATRVREAALVTAGVVVAAAATWIVLTESRFSTRRLRRLLAGVLAVDLALFNLFVIQPPITEAKAQAIGPLSAALRTQVGAGRSLIYDPDQIYPDQLYALGQTDLNIFTRVPSGQGYAALTDGVYFDATGAHYQEDLDPADLDGTVWDDLNVTTLLSLPSYFVTPVGLPPARLRSIPFPSPLTDFEFAVPPPPPHSFSLATGRARPWYFGGVLTVSSLTVPVLSGTPTGLRLGLITATGATSWLPTTEATVRGAGGHRLLEAVLPSPRRSAGLVVVAGGRPSTVGTPTIESAEGGLVALDGRMQDGVVPPHWTFTGTLGSFGVFRNDRVQGWAWVGSPTGGPAPGGSSATAGAPDANGEQQVRVHATAAAVLVRSESWSPGWRATIRTVPSGSAGTLGPPRAAPVDRSGVIQEVGIPGPGEYLVSFSYAATPAVVGVVVSTAAAGVVVLWALAATLARRRRARLDPDPDLIPE